MTKPIVIRTELKLPRDFRRADFLAFHARDQQAIAEQVDENSLAKGLLWHQLPTRLSIQFKRYKAEVSLEIDAAAKEKVSLANQPALQTQLLARAHHLLGLNQDLQDFYQRFEQHPELGPLIQHQRGLRVPQAAHPFEALTWGIIGQQISVAAAVSIRRNFIIASGTQHSSGLWCYPAAQQVAQLSCIQLQEAGLSQSKAQTILTLSQAVITKQLSLDYWLVKSWKQGHLDADEMSQALLAIKGIGPWTLSYALLRGFAWLDGSLHGDVAVRRNLQQLLNLDEKPTPTFTQQWLAKFSPYRALAAAHLWAQQSTQSY